MKLTSLALAAAAALLVSPSLASATVYTSEAAFDAAHPGSSTVSFTGLTSSINHVDSPFTYEGFTFSGSNLAEVSTSFWGSVDSLLDDRFNSHLDASFAAVDDIGFFVAGGYSDTPISITFYNGATPVFTDTPTVGGVDTNFTFYGVDGIGPITGLRLDSGPYDGGFASIGAISYSGGVPEPAAWALMLLGFGGLGVTLRRARAASALA